MYLFLDLKTKGVLGDKNKPYTGFDLLNISITKIAWLLVDEKSQILEKQHFVALGEDYVSSLDFEKYSRTSDATIKNTYNLHTLLVKIMKRAVDKAEVIVYNDIDIKDNLLNLLYTHEILFSNTPLEEKYRLCILEESKGLFENNCTNPLSLSTLYQKLFGKKLSKNLDLIDSLDIMSKCFFRLIDDNFFEFKGCNSKCSDQSIHSSRLPIGVKSINGRVCNIINNDNLAEKYNIRNSYSIKSNEYSMEIKRYNAKNTLTSWEEYTYRNHNLINVKVFTSAKGQISERQHTYDRQGNPDQIKYFNDKMESTGTNNIRYNKKGYLISEFIIKTDWSFDETNYRYNGLGGIYIEHMHYGVDVNYDKEYRKVDEKGNIVEVLRYKGFAPDCVALTIKFSYDEHDNLLEKIKTKMVGDDSQLVYKNVHRYEYTFDPMNNWVTKEEIINGIPSFSEKRELEYFTQQQ